MLGGADGGLPDQRRAKLKLRDGEDLEGGLVFHFEVIYRGGFIGRIKALCAGRECAGACNWKVVCCCLKSNGYVVKI